MKSEIKALKERIHDLEQIIQLKEKVAELEKKLSQHPTGGIPYYPNYPIYPWYTGTTTISNDSALYLCGETN